MHWLHPLDIAFKISPHADLGPVAAGDWDVTRRIPLARCAKHRSIRERYVEGRAWEDTDLFRDVYRRRFANGERVRGCASVEELLAQYYGRVDGMALDMERRGFRPEAGPLPGLLIGRGGEVFISSQGNHRLAIARALGLARIAGSVVCRHADA